MPIDLDAPAVPGVAPPPSVPDMPLEDLIAPPQGAGVPQPIVDPDVVFSQPVPEGEAIPAATFSRPAPTAQAIPADLVELHASTSTSIFKDAKPRKEADPLAPLPQPKPTSRTQAQWSSFLESLPQASLVNVRVLKRGPDGSYVNMGSRYNVDLSEVRQLDRFLPYGNGTDIPQRWIVAIQQNTARPDDERMWHKFLHERVGDPPPDGWSFDSVTNFVDAEVSDMATAREIAEQAVSAMRRQEQANAPAPAPQAAPAAPPPQPQQQQPQMPYGMPGYGMPGYGMPGYGGGYGMWPSMPPVVPTGRGGQANQMPYPMMYPPMPMDLMFEREKAERERQERAERMERERLDRDRQDRERLEREKAEMQRIEREREAREKVEKERKELEDRMRAEAEARHKELIEQTKLAEIARNKELEELRQIAAREREERERAERERAALAHQRELELLTARIEAMQAELRNAQNAATQAAAANANRPVDNSASNILTLMTEQMRADRETRSVQMQAEREARLEERKLRLEESIRERERTAAENDRNMRMYTMLGESQLNSARLVSDMITKSQDISPYTQMMSMMADNTSRNAQLVMGLLRSGIAGGGQQGGGVDWNALLGQGFELAGNVIGSLAEMKKQQSEAAMAQARALAEMQARQAANTMNSALPPGAPPIQATPRPVQQPIRPPVRQAPPQAPARSQAPAPAPAAAPTRARPPRAPAPTATPQPENEPRQGAPRGAGLPEMVETVKQAMISQSDPNDVADMLAALIQTAVAFKLIEKDQSVRNFVDAMIEDPERATVILFQGVAPEKYLKAVGKALIERHGGGEEEPSEATETPEAPEKEPVQSQPETTAEPSPEPPAEAPSEPQDAPEPVTASEPAAASVEAPQTEEKPKRGRRRKSETPTSDDNAVKPTTPPAPVKPEPEEPHRLEIPTEHEQIGEPEPNPTSPYGNSPPGFAPPPTSDTPDTPENEPPTS